MRPFKPVLLVPATGLNSTFAPTPVASFKVTIIRQLCIAEAEAYGILDSKSSLRSFLPQRLQSANPGDDLVEHSIDRVLVTGSRLEDAEVLEVGKSCGNMTSPKVSRAISGIKLSWFSIMLTAFS
jgi:hypothetical protein